MNEPKKRATPAPPIALIRKEASEIPGLDVRLLPRRWEKIGDVLILRVPPELRPWREAVAAKYAAVLGAKTVAEDVGGIHGPWRVPQVRRVWGDGTETVHVENGVRYRLDVAKVMFSSGNLDERVRIASVAHRGEVVVDLFAGIGYFSLPIAVHGAPASVIACEVNPTAFGYLQQNIALNRTGSVEARLGNCRDVAPDGVADRVVMGHFDAEKYLDVAFRAAKDRVTIHFHALASRGGSPADAVSPILQRDAETAGYALVNAEVRIVKSYGPRVRHVVADAEFIKR